MQKLRNISVSLVNLILIVTLKFLNFRTSENVAISYLKFKQEHQTLGNFMKKVNGIAKSE